MHAASTRADLERQLRDAPAAPAKPARAKAAGQAPAALMSTPAAAKSASTRLHRPNPRRQSRQQQSPPPPNPRLQPSPRRAPKAAAGTKARRSQGSQRRKAAAPKAPQGCGQPAAAKADNLRRLIGIGPVNEKLLKGQGVTTLRPDRRLDRSRHQADRGRPAISTAASRASAGSNRRSCWLPATRRNLPGNSRAREPPATPELRPDHSRRRQWRRRLVFAASRLCF